MLFVVYTSVTNFHRCKIVPYVPYSIHVQLFVFIIIGTSFSKCMYIAIQQQRVYTPTFIHRIGVLQCPRMWWTYAFVILNGFKFSCHK